MPYTKRDWQNSPSTSTPITAAALDDLEQQHDEAMADVAAAVGDPETDIGTALTATFVRVLAPSGDTTGVQDLAGIQALLDSGVAVRLMAGHDYYFAGAIAMPLHSMVQAYGATFHGLAAGTCPARQALCLTGP